MLGGEIRFLGHAGFGLDSRHFPGERPRFPVRRGKPQHHLAVHLDEPPIAVVGEARVAGALGQTGRGGVVQPQIQDAVHHAGHGRPRPGAHGQQQRIIGVAEASALLRLHRRDACLHRRGQRRGIGAIVFALVGTHRRGDRESRRHRQTDAGHFREVGAFAAKGLAHGEPSVRALRAEREDKLTAGFRHAADRTTPSGSAAGFAGGTPALPDPPTNDVEFV